MDLIARPLEVTDFGACAALFKGHLAYPDDVVALLPGVWHRLLRDDALASAVIEDRDRPGPSTIFGFAAGVFVTDAWVEAAKRGREPYLTARTILGEVHGTAPILRPAAIARGNDAGGLNVLNLHYCEAPDLPEDVCRALRFRMLSAFIEAFRGYRVKEVLQELWDEIDPDLIGNGWGRVRTDYASYFETSGMPMPPHGRRPYLIGITREEALAEPRDPIAPVFVHASPRFSFSPGERRLLRQALAGLTDAELAAHLELALPTVKSQWRAIYSRVESAAPHVLPDDVLAPAYMAGDARAIRGREKRRHLLDYLRRHPEELGPPAPLPSGRD
jgi:DNA-binding CsgD family transcriptional regulator